MKKKPNENASTHIAIKPLSEKTLKLFTDICWTVKQAQDKFMAAYTSALEEYDKNWRDNILKWDNAEDVVISINDQAKSHCLNVEGAKMPLTVWNKYSGAARMSIIFNVPFKFTNAFSEKQILRALRRLKELETAGTKGTREELLAIIFKEFRRTYRKGAIIRELEKDGLEVVRNDIKVMKPSGKKNETFVPWDNQGDMELYVHTQMGIMFKHAAYLKELVKSKNKKDPLYKELIEVCESFPTKTTIVFDPLENDEEAA
jgi:hypothetical protein